MLSKVLMLYFFLSEGGLNIRESLEDHNIWKIEHW